MESNGKDDVKYQKLMEMHKTARQDPSEKDISQKSLRAALVLAKTGEVSDDVIMAMQYLG